MKKLLSICWLVVSVSGVNAEVLDSTRFRPQIGIELLRMPFNAVLKKDIRPVQSLISIEPTIYIAAKKADRLLLFRAGYTQYSGAKRLGNIELSGKGGYLKAGKQSRHPDWVSFGWLGTVSVWRSKGIYRFDGPVFGDYLGPLKPKTNISVGIEGITELYAKLGRKWSLAIPIRLNIAIASSPRGYAEPYIPGIGFAPALFGTSFLRAGAGLNLYLLYQL